MPRFVFRLATLLKLRCTERDERRVRLAEAHAAEIMLTERIAQFDAQLLELARRYQAAASPGALDVDQLLDAQRYDAIVRAEKLHVAGQREAIRGEVEKRREALLAADREVRALEKLHDAQQERFRQQQQREEIKQLDEVAGRRGPREDAR